MTQIKTENQNAMDFRLFAKASRGESARRWCVVMACGLGLGFFAGCATGNGPLSDYTADTTPGHNGESWVGGE